MRVTSVSFLLTDADITSCSLMSMGGRSIGRLSSERPLVVDLPPGTHVLQARCCVAASDLDVHVDDVEQQEIRLAVVSGEMCVVS